MHSHAKPFPYDAVLIAGPTASGKSALALKIAQEWGGTIVNADSMQVYRELRILSARPSAADEARAPHLLYGHVPAAEAYSVGKFQIDAAAALHRARAAGRLPIFVGGTGMYFGVLTDGIADIPQVPDDIRSRARQRLADIGVAALHAELTRRDPATAAGLRPTDPQRVVRAYEVLEATGRPLIDWQREKGRPVLAGLRLAKLVVDLPRAELRARIKARFASMLEEGAEAEAAGLRGLDPALPAAKTLGLRELWRLQTGEIGRDEAIANAVTATGQFAKRQSTWLRNRMGDWHWPPTVLCNNISLLRQYLS